MFDHSQNNADVMRAIKDCGTGDDEELVFEVQYASRQLTITVESDGDPVGRAVLFAESVVGKLEECDARGKDAIVRDLLDTYNCHWREYEEVHENGKRMAVSNATLSADEFKTQFELEEIRILGASCVELWYGESPSFGGHSVFVNLMDGLDFSNPLALMFG